MDPGSLEGCRNKPRLPYSFPEIEDTCYYFEMSLFDKLLGFPIWDFQCGSKSTILKGILGLRKCLLISYSLNQGQLVLKALLGPWQLIEQQWR